MHPIVQKAQDTINIYTQERYTIDEVLGGGSYASTFKVIDSFDQYTLKLIDGIFQNQNTTTYAKNALREIRILKHLNYCDPPHQNIIHLHDLGADCDYSKFDGISIIYDHMETTLANIINTQEFDISIRRLLLFQIFRGLKYIHSANVLHRDLKPGNILVNQDCSLRICDFGQSRVRTGDPDHDAFLSNYVTTRNYRAPEMCLCYDEYGPAVDVWSVGCIVAQMILKEPLISGKNTWTLIQSMVSQLGPPTEEDLVGCTNQIARDYVFNITRVDPRPFDQLFQNIDELELDILSRMLCWNPNERITVDEALQHEYFESLYRPDDIVITEPLDTSDIERPDITLEELKWLLYNEIFPQGSTS